MGDEVLVIDDDARLASMVGTWLGKAGFRVTAKGTAAAGLAAVRTGRFAAVILDVMLPDGDGFEVCRTLRATSSIPVIMLSARGEDTDRIVGLELGADDYLPKPFHPGELLARLRAVLRRTRPAPARDVLRFGRLRIDPGSREVFLGDDAVRLTAFQFDVLLALAERAGRVVSRDQLAQLVRGDELDPFDRSLDVHVSRLRAALEADPREPKRILTVRGAGYLFPEKQP